MAVCTCMSHVIHINPISFKVYRHVRAPRRSVIVSEPVSLEHLQPSREFDPHWMPYTPALCHVRLEDIWTFDVVQWLNC